MLEVENEWPVTDEAGLEEEIAEIVERAKANPDACIYATLHYYPSAPA